MQNAFGKHLLHPLTALTI